jgi:hypothetical protein
MEVELPPIALINAWIFIKKSEHPDLKNQKFKALRAIKEIFGTVELAEFYIDQCKREQFKIKHMNKKNKNKQGG